MQRIQTQQQIKDLDLPIPFLEALLYFLSAEMRICAPKPYEPEIQGSIWLIEPDDTDDSLIALCGSATAHLTFDKVTYHQEKRYFHCLRVRANSICDTLIFPDEPWLSSAWKDALLQQIEEGEGDE